MNRVIEWETSTLSLVAEFRYAQPRILLIEGMPALDAKVRVAR